jgi:hypothetical protein
MGAYRAEWNVFFSRRLTFRGRVGRGRTVFGHRKGHQDTVRDEFAAYVPPLIIGGRLNKAKRNQDGRLACLDAAHLP